MSQVSNFSSCFKKTPRFFNGLTIVSSMLNFRCFGTVTHFWLLYLFESWWSITCFASTQGSCPRSKTPCIERCLEPCCAIFICFWVKCYLASFVNNKYKCLFCKSVFVISIWKNGCTMMYFIFIIQVSTIFPFYLMGLFVLSLFFFCFFSVIFLS